MIHHDVVITIDDGDFAIILITFVRQICCTELNIKFTLHNNINILLYSCSKRFILKITFRFSYYVCHDVSFRHKIQFYEYINNIYNLTVRDLQDLYKSMNKVVAKFIHICLFGEVRSK